MKRTLSMIMLLAVIGLTSACCCKHPQDKEATVIPKPTPPPLDVAALNHLNSTSGTALDGSELVWFDARELTVEGKGWTDTENFWERLPARAKGNATDAVWNLSKNTAGISVRFVTDSPSIGASWDGGGAMNHMAATGNSGLDLYARQKDGSWKFIAVGRPNTDRTTKTIATGQPAEPTEYMLYLPLYNPVKELRVGVEKDKMLAKGPARAAGRKPIVFYGTSITQGGCASRAGMAHPEILGRWLDREVINLGFSGSGKMEPYMAEVISELDPCLFVFECLPNMTEEMVAERAEPFVRHVREKHPDTPILLVMSPYGGVYGDNAKLKEIYEKLTAEGMKGLTLLPSAGQLDGVENGTVDGVHPTDLGFFRMATFYRPVLLEIIGE